MTRSREALVAWLSIFAAFAVGLFIGQPWSLIAGGLALAAFALAVASNFHGIADAMRVGLGSFWQQRSPAHLRLGFGLFAFMGLLVSGTGIVRLLA